MHKKRRVSTTNRCQPSCGEERYCRTFRLFFSSVEIYSSEENIIAILSVTMEKTSLFLFCSSIWTYSMEKILSGTVMMCFDKTFKNQSSYFKCYHCPRSHTGDDY